MNEQPAQDGAATGQLASLTLVRSTSVTGSMTLLSRLTGLARDIAIGRLFGAGPLVDAFIFAFKLPNLLRRFFAEGAFAQAFVPVISEYRATRSAAEARDLIARVAGSLAAALFVVSVIGVVAAPLLVLVFGTGLVAGDGPADVATSMLRFTFPYILFISLTAMAGSVLNAYGRFAVPAFTPVLLNLTMIGAALWLSPRLNEPTLALAIGVFVAGVVQLAFQLPFLIKERLLPRPRIDFAHEGVRRILKLMLPIMFGSSIAQINIFFDTWIALFLAGGSATWLYYADRLVEFPLGVFGIAIATVILPTLSSQHARASVQSFDATIDWALRSVLLIGVPAAAGLFLLAEPLFATLFYGGEFDETDVAMAGGALRAFAPGLVGFILVKVLVAGFYSRQDTRTPVMIGVRALLLGMLLNVVFVVTLVLTGWAAPHIGLAAATTISSLTNAILLFRSLIAAGVYRPRPDLKRIVARVAMASVVMTVFVVWAVDRAGDWFAMTLALRAAWLCTIAAVGASIYFAVGWALGLRLAQFRIR